MKIVKELLQVAAILLGTILFGTLLLVGVYIFPTGRIKENVANSSHIFDIEEAFPELIPGEKYTRLDNFTDSIMLALAMYDGEEGAAEKAMASYRMRSDELGIVKSTTHYANDVEADYYRHSYPRYWHGYLVFLKPLLAFFTYGEIRILNGIVQLGLLIFILNMLFKSRIKAFLPAYVAAILFINPMVVSLSLQYSAVYNIVLVIMALWLWLMRKDKLSEYKILLFFLISGMVTSYIDFLTYPIAVVGILSVLSVHTLGVEWRNILFTFKNIVYWGIGYIGMWVGKWLMGSIILRKNLFEDAVEQFLLRASSGNASNNRLDGIRDNLGIYSNKIFVCLFAVLIIYSIIVLWRMKIKVKREQWLEIGSYGIIMLMPFVWMFLAANHSQEHAWFVHRGLSVSVLALGSIFICLKEKSSTS